MTRVQLRPGGRVALLLGILAFPAAFRSGSVPFQPESRLWFEGTSTVRDFTCQAESLVGQVTTAPEGPRLAVGELGETFRGVDVSIPVAALDCRNGTMNTHMRRALQADAHPSVEFVLTGYEIVREGAGDAVVRLSGALTMAGQSRSITFETTATATGDGGVRVAGSHRLQMTEWGIRPPSLMLGAMRVRDPVTVRFDVVLRP